jgi:hypothetical protein
VAEHPVYALRGMLPPGWAITRVERNTYPWYRPKGRGIAVYLVEGRKYLQAPFSVALFIMPADYPDDLTVKPGEGQTEAPALIAALGNGKVFFWGEAPRRIKGRLLDAVIRDE